MNSFALAMWIIYFISTEICMISRFHFRGLLIEISCEFVSPRTVKKHSTNNKGKRRKFLPSTTGFWVQLRSLTAATREWLPESLLEVLFSRSCMRSKISSVNTSHLAWVSGPPKGLGERRRDRTPDTQATSHQSPPHQHLTLTPHLYPQRPMTSSYPTNQRL